MTTADKPKRHSFDQRFPKLTAWIQGQGWIELGADEYSTSMIRILDMGGMVWENDEEYPKLDDLLQAAEQALADLEADGEL